MDTEKLAEIKLECLRIAGQYSNSIDNLIENAKKLAELVTQH